MTDLKSIEHDYVRISKVSVLQEILSYFIKDNIRLEPKVFGWLFFVIP